MKVSHLRRNVCDRFRADLHVAYMILLGNADVALDGWAEFKSPAESISIWTKTDARGRDEFKKD
jgi:hypothetical protein